MITKHKKLSYILAYTGVFVLTALIAFWPNIINQKLFIYTHDGYYQHFNSLAYYGKYLRELFTELFVNHSFRMPMFDLSLGLGSDVLTTLHYYCIGDPLYLLTGFVTEGRMELFHTFLIVFRVYLAGLTFSALAIKLGNRRKYTLFGAIIYAFSGYMLIPGVMHIMFQPAAIYLPLVLLGIEKLLRKEKPHVFIWATAVAVASNFYFFYMIALFAVIYFVFRYVQTEGEGIGYLGIISGLVRKGLKIAGFAVISLLISALILLPVIMAMLSSQRMGVSHYVPVLYDWKYYLTYLPGFMTTQWLHEGTFYTYLGFSAMAVVSVAVLFAKESKSMEPSDKRSVKTLRYSFIMMVMFAAIPFLGYALTAFSYVNNRWVFAFAALVAYIAVKAIGYIEHLSLKEIRRIGVILFLYGLMCYVPETMREDITLTQIILLMALLVIVVMTMAGVKFLKNNTLILLALTIISVGMNGMYACDNVGGLLKRGEALSRLTNNPVKVVSAMNDDSVSRFEMEDIYEAQNMAWHEGKYGTGFYFSVLNGNISKFLTDYELPNTTEYSFTSMDARSILDLALGVKYAVVQSGEDNKRPAIYDKKVGNVSIGDGYSVYTAKNVLPLGYTYDKLISPDAYEKMDAITKQEVLLQGAWVDAGDDARDIKLEYLNPSIKHVEPEFDIVESDGVVIDGNSFTADAEGASLTVQCSGLANSENYLEFTNLRYTDVNRAANVDTAGMPLATKLDVAREVRNFIPEDKGYFYIDGLNGKQSHSVNNDRQPAYSGKHNYLYNVGFLKDGDCTFRIIIKTPGVYTFDSMKMYSQPMEDVAKLVEERAAESLRDVKVDVNEIAGKITCSKENLLCLAVPFSKGVKVFVDGTEKKIYRVNSMFTGVYLGAGEHNVRMVYETPYLKLGAMLTVLGLVLYIGYCILLRYKNNRLGKEKQ